MINYIYDGSFEGLLTAIYEAYYRRENPDRIVDREDAQQNLFTHNVHISTNLVKADRVYRSIQEKISPYALENVLYAFLSEYEEMGTWIYRYLQLGWKTGEKVDLLIGDDRVLKIHEICRKVKFESHRMLGLVRFQALADSRNIYYAPIQPDHNIVGLIAPHFASRLSDQNWMIHDVGRNIAALYNQKEWIMTSLSTDKLPPVGEEEMAFQSLWKQYFQSIVIKDRINPKLQKRCMPMRYWRYLVEKQQ